MKFTKAPLSIPGLVAHLVGLGLRGDPDVIGKRLLDVGYYRLSPYWRFYRIRQSLPGSELLPGTSIDQVWSLYTFDRELRLLVLDAIERVEVGVRARLVQHHVEAHGAFGYADDTVFTDGARGHYRRLLDDSAAALIDAVNNPRAPRVPEPLRHFARTYADQHAHMPLWLAAERFSLGDLVTLYRGSPSPVRKATAKDFGVPDPVFESWLLSLQTVRNVCAHHGRLWNRALGTRPLVPAKLPGWSDPVLGRPDQLLFTLTILALFMSVLSDGSSWAGRLRALVEERYPHVPRGPMGMSGGWTDHPIWAARLAAGGP